MNKIFTCFVSCLLPAALFAQKQTVNVKDAPVVAYQQYQPYGKVDIADLELKSCDFEPDANAMVLFNKAKIYYDNVFAIVEDVHKRIKIFNDNLAF